MSLLIVDDSQETRDMIREIVRDVTDLVVDCPDGDEAVIEYERHRPAWVCIDLHVGGAGGLEATRRLRGAFPEARIVIVTDHDAPGLRRAAREAGAEHFVAREDLLFLRRLVGKA
jgi:CheY-like chemotaxis protein